MRRVPVFYDERMVADSRGFSPSGRKPRPVVDDWSRRGLPISVHAFDPVTPPDLMRCHDPAYVRGVLSGHIPNGHGNTCMRIAESLLWTNGSFIAAARHALTVGVACSPSSGFHHANYESGGGFCTFNALALTVVLLQSTAPRIAIIDADAHYGDGTDAIIERLDLDVEHWTFGRSVPAFDAMMDRLEGMFRSWSDECLDLLLYQAGADPHVEDPLGGFLTSEQMRLRDRLVFTRCAEHGIPVVWNLAGGYQQKADGSIPAVLDLHRATMEECAAAFVA